MQPASKARTVDAPAAERLDAAEAAAWCRIDRRQWYDLVRFKLIPDGARVSRQTRLWRWEEVIAVNALLPHLLRMLVKSRRAAKVAHQGGKVAPQPRKERRSGAPPESV